MTAAAHTPAGVHMGLAGLLGLVTSLLKQYQGTAGGPPHWLLRRTDAMPRPQVAVAIAVVVLLHHLEPKLVAPLVRQLRGALP